MLIPKKGKIRFGYCDSKEIVWRRKINFCGNSMRQTEGNGTQNERGKSESIKKNDNSRLFDVLFLLFYKNVSRCNTLSSVVR